MTDTRELLERQAQWQKGRAALTWPEKIRMAEAVRESVAHFSRARSSMTAGVTASKRPGTGEARSPGKQKE